MSRSSEASRAGASVLRRLRRRAGLRRRRFLTAPLVNAGLAEPVLVRDFSLMWRAIIALMIGYSSFIAEVFRAGIQSVDQGQIEAIRRSACRATIASASWSFRRRSR